MFRVPLDTVLRRASVTSLLVLVTALSACGGDDKPANASSSSGQSALDVPGGDVEAAPEGTSPEELKKQKAAAAAEKARKKARETDEVLPGGVKAVRFTKAEGAVITDHVENEATIARASNKTIPEATVKKQIETIRTSLISATGKKIEVLPEGSAGNVGEFKIGSVGTSFIGVMIFTSNRKATEATRNYQQFIGTRPGYGRADVRGARMWMLSNPKKYTASDVMEFRKVRDAIEAKL